MKLSTFERILRRIAKQVPGENPQAELIRRLGWSASKFSYHKKKLLIGESTTIQFDEAVKHAAAEVGFYK